MDNRTIEIGHDDGGSLIYRQRETIRYADGSRCGFGEWSAWYRSTFVPKPYPVAQRNTPIDQAMKM